MRDDVGVDVLAEVESDGKASWVGIGTCIWNLRKAGGVGEAESDGGGRAGEVGCGGEFFGCLSGCEGAVEYQPTSMSCA